MLVGPIIHCDSHVFCEKFAFDSMMSIIKKDDNGMMGREYCVVRWSMIDG
jgi:hypothetical protein